MVIKREVTRIHWNYFLALEEDFERLSRFVELCDKNDSVYSIEIARLLLSACSEVDVILQRLCKKLDPSVNETGINFYRDFLHPKLRNFTDFGVEIPRYGMSTRPWSNWNDNKPPDWWSDHNKVKHHRHEHFDKATVKNCVNSLAGLFVAILHLYSEHGGIVELSPTPRLFSVEDKFFGGVQIGRVGQSFICLLNHA